MGNPLSAEKTVAGKVQRDTFTSHFRDLGEKGAHPAGLPGGSEVQGGPGVEGILAVEVESGLHSKGQEDGAGQMLHAKGLD